MRLLRAAAKALLALARLCDEQRKTMRVRRRAFERHLAGGAPAPRTTGQPTASSRSPSPPREPPDEADEEQNPFQDLIDSGERLSREYAGMAAGAADDMPPALRAELGGASSAATTPSAQPAGEPPASPAPEEAAQAPAWAVVPPTEPTTPRTARGAAWANMVATHRREAAPPPPAQ